ncbi:ABC transporter ATP-binding protein [Dactylosporangium aurantiacum]|uniref:ABC transporter ATP-binding protein n=1 Tax=Dactylosporangium aurantiacum TaxID=35754 RepID=A0A9Q9MKT2_9ACTN|nr:ABC transporter ATP-binding protein [Dactylosporangium aurantiacum]MDG6106213.1 ABC transporter ATP-binding protein [Dactylosporangium aurantiacum]UWZ58285.1 ABC transporter ATP-binding protein [Dactylosporangium aurantiacum]
MTRTFRHVVALVWRAAPRTAGLSPLLALTAGLTPVVTAWLTKLAIDDLVAGAPARPLLGLAAALVAVAVTAALVPHCGEYLRVTLGRTVGAHSLDRLFTAVGRFSGLARFEDPAFQDRLRLAQQATATSSQLVDDAQQALRGLLTVAGFAGSLVALNPVMAGVVALAAVPTVAAELSLARQRADLMWRVGPVERREAFYAQLLGGTAAAKEIRLFGFGGWLRDRMLAERRDADRAKRVMDARDARTQSVLSGAAALVAGGGLVWALLAVRAGGLTVGDLSMFVAAVAGVQAALSGVISQYAGIHHQLLLFTHYLDVVTAGPDLPEPDRPCAVPPLRDGIELRDVWFRYSDEHPWVLRGVNLHIPHGTAVALVGLNGAGKSTLVKLLCRFYDPTAGTVYWDGVDIRRFRPEDLRARLGAVFQDYVTYDLTARENIAVGDLGALADDERITGAARLAGVHDVLRGLPRGYDTLLTRMFFDHADKADADTGVVLSGGQWQRLALARAFLRERPDLVMLDEPSAGLDAEAEHELHRRIRRHRGRHTSLLISHRLAAVRDADLIVVLADGVVAELGAHPALVARGGQYARLFALQASGYREEAA